jgi:ABC-type cobalamin/Fe3+-siderophores transport system ATPase subunit
MAQGAPREVLTPEHIRAAYEIEVEVRQGRAGALIVAPVHP